MKEFFVNIGQSVSFADIIDILIVAFIIYKALEFMRETRAEQLVKGLLLLVGATFFSELFHLYTLNWILKGTMTLGVVALVIVFQPELRRALELMGRSKIVSAPFAQLDKDKIKAMVSEIVKSVETFSMKKTGALIVFERETSLNDIIETGTKLDAEISYELIGNIFYSGSPLHDGAAVIRGDRLQAAGCVLPLTQNRNLSKDLGTRHRAGIGITENSDAIVLIVSEETGIISMVIDGNISRFLDIKTVEKTLLNAYLEDSNEKINFKDIKDMARKVGWKNDASK